MARAQITIALGFVIALAGCAGPPTPDGSPSPARSAGPSAGPTEPPVTPTPTPLPRITTLGHGRAPLEAGTYRLDPAALTPGGVRFPTVELTLPDGWHSLDGWAVHRDDLAAAPVGIQLWDVAEVYGHPCQWAGTLFDPGPGVRDLAAALHERPMRNATEPMTVTVSGHGGMYLEWEVPADVDFSTCDAEDGTHYFESWTGPENGWATDRYQQGPGQIDRLWILDVGVRRLVLDAFSMPDATEQELDELMTIVESIRILPT